MRNSHSGGLLGNEKEEIVILATILMNFDNMLKEPDIKSLHIVLFHLYKMETL